MMMEEQSRDESVVLASSWSWWWPRGWWAPILRWWRPTSENQELGGRTDGEISGAATSAHGHGYNGNTTPDDDSYDQDFDATNREPGRDVSRDDEVCMNDESRRWWPRRWWLMWWGSTSENQELGGRTDGEISGAATSAHGHGYNGNTTPDDSSCDQDFDATNREPGSDNKESRRPMVIICTSLSSDSIRGLKEKLEGLSSHQGTIQGTIRRAFQTLRRRKHHMTFEVREELLPFSYLDKFRFPSDIGRHDAMILCHSIENRGLSITDTESALYDKYLAYCNETFGTSRVAVIVHDFNLSEVNLDNHMAAFKRDQPKTFGLAGLVLLGGNFTRTSKIELGGDGWNQVKTFVRNAVTDQVAR